MCFSVRYLLLIMRKDKELKKYIECHKDCGIPYSTTVYSHKGSLI